MQKFFARSASATDSQPAAMALAPRSGARLWWTLPALFLLMLRFGSAPSLELDPSWSEVLRWASAHDRIFGADIVFTYGPLGFLHPLGAYFPSHDALYFIAQILIALGEAAVVALALRNLSNVAALGLILVLIVWTPWVAGDAQWYATFAFAFVVAADTIDNPGSIQRGATWGLLCALLATIALIKFTATVIFALWVVAVSLLLWQRGRRRDALILCASAALTYVALWLAAGQPLLRLFGYLLASFEVASGYTSAMSMQLSDKVEVLGFIVLAANVLWLAWMFATARTRPGATIATGFLACVLFLLWRGGMTRGDHCIWFFACASLFSFAAIGYARGLRFPRATNAAAAWAAAGACAVFVATSVAPLHSILPAAAATLSSNVSILLDPKAFLNSRRVEWAAMRDTVHLPHIRATIGDESVDMLMVEQGMVLAGGFNYQPRPIFQSYNAWTPDLLRMNEAFFAGRHAPHFVIVRLQPIDGRFPMQEDGLALAMLLRRYRPRLIEAGYLLLERTANQVALIHAPPPSQYRTIHLGEPFAIPSGETPMLAFVEVRLSLLGKLRAFLLREPSLQLRVTTEQGDTRVFRLVRRTAESGFVVSPLEHNAADLLNLADHDRHRHVASIVIAPAHEAQSALFEGDIRIATAPLDGPLVISDRSAFARNQAYKTFSDDPIDQSGEFDTLRERDHDVVFMHAPAWMDFDLTAGTYSVTGTFGILDKAIGDPNCAQADGVGASLIVTQEDKSPRTLWHEDINPFTNAAERGAQTFNASDVVMQQHGTLRFAFDPGNGGSGATTCDWSYLADLHIARASQ